MRIMVSGGTKTENLVKVLENRFKSGSVEFTMEKNIRDIEKFSNRGDYFDRAIIMEQSWTEDNTSDDEFKMRKDLSEFITFIKNRYTNFEVVFVTSTPERANMALEESLDIEMKSVVILKPGPYYASFMASLSTDNLDSFPRNIRFNIEDAKKIVDTESEARANDITWSIERNIKDGEGVGPILETVKNTAVTFGEEEEEESEDTGIEINDFDSDLFDSDGQEFSEGAIEEEIDDIYEEDDEYEINYEKDEEMHFDEDALFSESDIDDSYFKSDSTTDEEISMEEDNEELLDEVRDYEIDDDALIEEDEEQELLISDAVINEEKVDIEDNLSEDDNLEYDEEYIEETSDELEADEEADEIDEDYEKTAIDETSWNTDNEEQSNEDADDLDELFSAEYDKADNKEVESVKEETEDIGIDLFSEEESYSDSDETELKSDKEENSYDDKALANELFGEENYKKIDDTEVSEGKSINKGLKFSGVGNTKVKQKKALLRKSRQRISKDNSLDAIMKTSLSRGKSIIVTGGRNSGKTVVASNLANIISKAGYTVLVVDMDTLGRGMAYINKEIFDIVHSITNDNVSLVSAINSSTNDLGRSVNIIRPGYHVLTIGLAADMQEGKEILNLNNINKFNHSVKSIYNYIIFDIQFDELTTSFKDILFNGDEIVNVLDTNTHGLVDFMLKMANIEDDDVMEHMFTMSSILFNKVTDMNMFMGYKIKTVEQVLQVLDLFIAELVGEGSDLLFSRMKPCGLLNFSTAYERFWFADKQVSDTEDGEKIFTEILKGILLNKNRG